MASTREPRGKTFEPPAIQNDYGTLWLTLQARANQPGGIDENQARIVHNRWKRIGKLAQAGRL